MEVRELGIEGVFEINLKPHVDKRGFFMRTFDYNIFDKYGLNRNWVQENHSKSDQKGIIRGLHFQFPPFTETKLVRCINGAVLDVFLDLRRDSETFGKFGTIKLSAETKNMVLIPRGFAHGFCTLTDISEVLYKVDNYYNPDKEGGILYNDPELGIDWHVSKPILSEKDQNNMTLQTFVKKFGAIDSI